MSRSRLVMCFSFAGVLALASGCARQSPATSLAQIKQDNVRQLSMACYWHHDGERIVAGSAEVYLACRRWAEERMQAQFPQSVGANSTAALTSP
ncbi:MAG: hypothetical protein V2I41_18570 [Pseudomonadales bacterium]|nr:hypothetical protein [Pseudomonadales bacterium]